jgi:hypothetical protein
MKVPRFFGTLSDFLKNKSEIIIRVVLFLTFFGHGLISLGHSKTYSLHYKLVSTLNFTGISNADILFWLGIQDLVLASLILSGFFKRFVLTYSAFYLLIVGISAFIVYWIQFGKPFGFGEIFKRLSWASFAFFLLYLYSKGSEKFSIIRYGLAFAFLGHGFGSLGFGFSAAHVDLAQRIVVEEIIAKKLVFIFGFSDIAIGILLLIGGIFSRIISFFAFFWILIVDYASFLESFADGLFRLAWLLVAFFVVFEKRCHN